MKELEDTGQEVVVLLYHHDHGTDAGVYTDIDAARRGMVDTINGWSESPIDTTDPDVARTVFEEQTHERFDFIPAGVRRLRPAAVHGPDAGDREPDS